MSSIEQRALALMRGEATGFAASVSRGGLRLLSLVYGAVITIYWWMYRLGLLRRTRLRAIVVSVGNITVGGTGKTTAIQYIARVLSGAGKRVVVLSYGYHAGSRDTVGLVSDGKRVLLGSAEAGDEAVLLAQSLPGVPVLIGRRRVLSGAEAERRYQPDVILCDDAFQYWRLYRDVDLVLVDAVEPWGYGYLLPRGLMREPKRRLARASAFLVTHADLVSPEQLAALRAELSGFGRPVWTAAHSPRGLTRMDGAAPGTLADLAGAEVLAVSSLGDPASFEATLKRSGAEVTPCRFPDHHHYTVADAERAQGLADAGRLMVVTTAKDAVKLRGMSVTDQWRILEIVMYVDDSESFDEWVKAFARR